MTGEAREAQKADRIVTGDVSAVQIYLYVVMMDSAATRRESLVPRITGICKNPAVHDQAGHGRQ